MEIKGSVLISTLGTEPQVVTLALLSLLKRGEVIKQVTVIHSASPRNEITAAVDTLAQNWPQLPFSDLELQLVEAPVRDIASEASLKIAYATIREAISQAKSAGLRIHLNISGGRKPLALCAMIAAQFLFDAQDRLWYLFSSSELVKSRRLLPQPADSYHLINIPVPIWTESGALLSALATYDDPWAISELQRKLLHQEERMKWKHFWDHVLTKAEKEVIEALVRGGGTNAEIAARLGKSPRTVGHQLSRIFQKAREFLGWPEDIRIDRTAIVSLLAPYIREIYP